MERLTSCQGRPSNLQSLVPVLNSPSSERELSLQEKNVAAYIGGHIVHEINNTVYETCQGKLNAEVYSRNRDFLAAKNYCDAKV